MNQVNYDQVEEHENICSSKPTECKGAWRKRTIATLAILSFVTSAAIAQSDNVLDIASPARPKVDTIETVEIEGVGYDLPIYIQEGGEVVDKDAHFYYTPLLSVVTESNKKLKHHIDDNNVLTLKVRLASDQAKIEKAVRESLIKLAKEIQPHFQLDSGSVEYRIDPLQLSGIVFESGKKRLQNGEEVLSSEPVEMLPVASGEINIYFYLDSRETAEKFVRDLEENNDQLVFSYRFDGVSDEVCRVTYRESNTRGIEVFKNVVGEGGKGKVARHQAASIADTLAQSGSINARCSHMETAEDLVDRLIDRLGETESTSVAGWEKLLETIAFDVDSFKADVVKSVETQKKSVHRDQVLEALSEAGSSAETSASQVGGEVGVKLWKAKLNVSLADSESESKSNARKLHKDTLAKEGVYGEWEGEEFIPKSVDVYTTADLDNAWGKTFEISFALTEGTYGGAKIPLTHDSWENSINSAHQRSMAKQLREALNLAQTAKRDAQTASTEFPVGGITMFFGRERDLPPNWKIANGQRVNDSASPLNGQTLPDLRNTFVRGAGNDREVGDVGGRDTRDTHTHTIDVNYWTVRDLMCVDYHGSDYDCEGYALSFSPWTNNDIIPHATHDGTKVLINYTANRYQPRGGVSEDENTDLDNRPRYMEMHYIIRIK